MSHRTCDWCNFVRSTVASRSQRVSLIVIPFCLSVWMSLGHSATYSLPRLIDHNQIWSAIPPLYLSSDPCKPFWIPYLPYFRCQREKYAKFRLFPSERDAPCHDLSLMQFCFSSTLRNQVFRFCHKRNIPP